MTEDEKSFNSLIKQLNDKGLLPGELDTVRSPLGPIISEICKFFITKSREANEWQRDFTAEHFSKLREEIHKLRERIENLEDKVL